MRADGGADAFTAYIGSKFVQLLGAHYWRRALQGICTVVAVSPGLIPDTGIFRHADTEKRPTMASNDAKTVEEGQLSISFFRRLWRFPVGEGVVSWRGRRRQWQPANASVKTPNRRPEPSSSLRNHRPPRGPRADLSHELG